MALSPEKVCVFHAQRNGPCRPKRMKRIIRAVCPFGVTNSGVIDIDDLKLMAKLRGADWV